MNFFKWLFHKHDWKDTDNWNYKWVEQVCYCGKTRKVVNTQ